MLLRRWFGQFLQAGGGAWSIRDAVSCLRYHLVELRSLPAVFALAAFATLAKMDPWQRISNLTQQLKYMEENIAGYRASLREAKAENEVTGRKQRFFFVFFCLCLTLTRSCRSVFHRRILL